MVSPFAADAPSSVGTAYARYASYVRKVLSGCGVSSADVPDLTHEVFVVLLRRIEEQRRPEVLRSWLFQTARRVASNYRRGTRRARDRIARIPEPESDPSPEDGIARREAATFVARFLEDLDPDGRRLFVLSEIEGVRGTEVANRLGLNLKTAYSRVYALRRRFERAAAKEFGRRPESRAWLIFAGLGREWSRALRKGLVIKMGVTVTLLALLLGAWRLLRPTPEGGEPPAAPPPVWNPADEADLRRELQTAALASREVRATLVGRVLEIEGAGIEGARVCAWRHAMDFSTTTIAEPTCTQSGPDGRYRLEDVVPGQIRLTAAAKGFLPDELQRGTAVALRVTAGEQSGLDILLRAGGVALSGMVEDMTGGPVEGVTIVLQPEPSNAGRDPVTFGAWGDRPPTVVVSGTDGRFGANVIPGLNRWQALAAGYAGTRGETVAPSDGLVIRIAPEAVLAGIVVDAGSGEPLGDMHVVAWADPRSLTNAGGGVDTEDDGGFRITGLPPGRYKPWAIAPGRIGVAERAVVLGLGETVEDLRIPVSVAPIVRARVTVSGSGEPCPGGAVGLREVGRSRMEWQLIEDNGEVLFPAVLPGRYRPQLGCEGYRSAPFYAPVEAGTRPTTELSWMVFEGVTLAGEVLRSDGSPAKRSLVTIEPLEGPMRFPRGLRADDSGRFSLAGLTEGSYSVTAVGAGEATPQAVNVELGSEGADLSLRLGAAGVVRGVIADAEGTPVAGAVVRLQEPEHGRGTSLRTTEDGRFEFTALPLRAYVVAASRNGTARGGSQRVELDPESPEAELQLEVGMDTGTIAGRVVDEAGQPIPDALITLGERGRGVTVAERSVLSGSEGQFTLTELARGPHAIFAVAPDGASGELRNVEAGEDTHIEIGVPATASATGRIVIDRGDLPSVFEVSAAAPGRQRIAEVFVSTDGTWTLEGVPSGPVTFSAVTELGRARAKVTLAPGEHRESIELQLAGRVDLVGQIVDLETGEPLKDYVVVATAFDDGRRELAKQAEMAMGVAPGDPRQVTGEDGRFLVPGVSVGVTNLVAMPKGFPETPLLQILTVVAVPLESELRLPALRRRIGPDESPGRTGLELERGEDDQPWTIRSVDADGPAAAIDIQPGDTITAIDGHDVTGIHKYLARQLLHAAPGSTVELTLARGPTVRLTLSTTR